MSKLTLVIEVPDTVVEGLREHFLNSVTVQKETWPPFTLTEDGRQYPASRSVRVGKFTAVQCLLPGHEGTWSVYEDNRVGSGVSAESHDQRFKDDMEIIAHLMRLNGHSPILDAAAVQAVIKDPSCVISEARLG